MSTLAAGPAPTLDDILRLFSETDRKFQETDRKFQDTDRKFQDTDRKFQDTDRILKERAAETDRIIKSLSINLGNIGNRMGEFVQYMVEPTVVQLFKSQGIEVHEVHPNVQVERGGEGMEVDLLVVNDGALVAVECKSKLTREDVDKHLQRMEKLKRLLPTYRHHQAFGAVAALVVPNDVADYAQGKGFYVLAQNGETVEVRNDSQFSAKVW
ncbi:MAG: hypothetical protein WC091_17325 [Sulfuricellaceae bacterium]